MTVTTLYDKELDILYISKNNKKTRFSVGVSDFFILDIGFKNNVVGLEILGASRNLNIHRKQLENIKKANVRTFTKNKKFMILFYIEFEKEKIESRITIPIGTRVRKR